MVFVAVCFLTALISCDLLMANPVIIVEIEHYRSLITAVNIVINDSEKHHSNFLEKTGLIKIAPFVNWPLFYKNLDISNAIDWELKPNGMCR